MPTPTPIPSSQIVQAVQASQNIIDNAVQQGIVGVLQLLAIGVVLYLILQLLKTYIQRNNKPDNTGINEAIKAMADGSLRSAEREERLENERRQEREEWRKHIAERDNKFIEAVNNIGDGYNRIGDVLVGQAELQKSIVADHKLDINTINAMKDDIGQMVNVGSVPLRNLITETRGIKDDTDKIPTIQKQIDELCKMIEQLLQNKADCVDFKKELTDFEQRVLDKIKRTTDSQPIVILPPNVTPDTASGADGKAAA